jgi:hypothetical protein
MPHSHMRHPCCQMPYDGAARSSYDHSRLTTGVPRAACDRGMSAITMKIRFTSRALSGFLFILAPPQGLCHTGRSLLGIEKVRRLAREDGRIF